MSAAELAVREKLARVYKKRRIDEGLTQEELGRRIDPASNHPNAYVSRFERNAGGNFGVFDMVEHARAISPAFTLAEALVTSGVERATLARNADSTLVAIETDPRLLAPARRILAAGVRQGYNDFDLEMASALRVAEQRDDARRAGIPEEMLAAWQRLTAEQRADLVSSAEEQAADNAETPAPRGRGRRRPNGKNA